MEGVRSKYAGDSGNGYLLFNLRDFEEMDEDSRWTAFSKLKFITNGSRRSGRLSKLDLVLPLGSDKNKYVSLKKE
jgi:hypothetical protein